LGVHFNLGTFAIYVNYGFLRVSNQALPTRIRRGWQRPTPIIVKNCADYKLFFGCIGDGMDTVIGILGDGRAPRDANGSLFQMRRFDSR